MNFDSIIFDLDGTLWDSTYVVTRAWNDAIRRHPGVKEVSHAQIESVAGLTLDEIGERLFPSSSEEEKRLLLHDCGENECSFLAVSGGKLYPGLEDTLKQLSPKYRLFIVSNCQTGYIEAFFHAHGLGNYFTDYECAENTGLTKGENISLVIKRNGLKAPVYIGDTLGDYQASKAAGIPFIHAEYGFGSVPQMTFSLSRITSLPALLQELEKLSMEYR